MAISKKKVVPVATVNIHATFNNTIVSIADQQGDVLVWASGGTCGFKCSRKSTPYAGQKAAESALQKALDYGVKTLYVVINGPGAGRESAVRAVNSVAMQHSLSIISIKDVTPVPHNGTRPPKKRRV